MPRERAAVGMNAPLEVVLAGAPKARFDLGDHVAAANDANFVAQPEVEALHLANVVQGGVLHRYTGDHLWCNAGDGRHGSPPAGLPIDGKQDGNRFLRWEFPSQGPSWMVGGHPQALTVCS